MIGTAVWDGETDIAGETVLVERVGDQFYVHFFDGRLHVEETPPLDRDGALQVLASRFADGRIPEGDTVDGFRGSDEGGSA